MTRNKGPIVVIGGGVCGIMAARTLLELGEENVLLLDKGRGLGGRMNTREFSGARFDHGVSFFSAHTTSFQQLVNSWETEGWVKEFPAIPNGYFGSNGMNAFIRHLADPIDFCVRVRVTKIEQEKVDGLYVGFQKARNMFPKPIRRFLEKKYMIQAGKLLLTRGPLF